MKKLRTVGFLAVYSLSAVAEEIPENFTSEIEHILLNSGMDQSVELHYTSDLLDQARKETLDSYLKHYLNSSFGQVLKNPSSRSFLDEDKQIFFSKFLQNDETPPYLPFIKRMPMNDSVYKAAFEEYQIQYRFNKTAGALGMGILYHQGWGVPQSLQKSLSYFKEAAYNENPIALTVLGYFHHSKESDHYNRNQAIEYYKNALKDLKDTTTSAFLAEILLLSPENPQDREKGKLYLQYALEAEEPYAFLITAYELYQQVAQSTSHLSIDKQKRKISDALNLVEKASSKGLKNTQLLKDALEQKLESLSQTFSIWSGV